MEKIASSFKMLGQRLPFQPACENPLELAPNTSPVMLASCAFKALTSA